MWDVIRTLVADGSTVLLTTQYLDEADALADRITVFDHGRVIADDTPEGLKRIVGGQTLRVRPADPGRLDEVRAILADVAGGRAAAGTEPQSPGRGVLSVPVAGDAALAATVARLGAAGIAVTELSLHLPSLDEVFFTLTGSRATNTEAVA
jgi:oleandomycin transport system ATP-binding protein